MAKNKLRGRMLLNPGEKMILDGSRVRSGKMAHFCYEWDEELIDETDPEFDSCLCGRTGKAEKRHKK